MSSPFSTLSRTPPGPGQTLTLARPAGSADAWVLADWALRLRAESPSAATGARLLVACESAQDAQRLAEEIPFFGSELRVRLLPDWETLPYEAFSPHQDLVSERLLTLYEASTGACDVLVLSASTALQRLSPPAFLAAHTFFFRKGQKISAERLRTQLETAGYSPVSQVVSPGEVAWRGGRVLPVG